jgi:hypothetical protein
MICVIAQDLDTGKEYEFRVVPKNRAGLGEPSSPSKSVVTKPKSSKFLCQFIVDISGNEYLLDFFLRSRYLVAIVISLLECAMRFHGAKWVVAIFCYIVYIYRKSMAFLIDRC